MNSTNKEFFIAAAPLFLIIFIDSMGLGLVFPLLNAIIIDPTTHFFTHYVSPNFRNFIFGSTIGIFMLAWFFGASILGDLSDQIGRKKALLICLIGAFVGYFLSAIGVILKSYSLILIGRIVAGFTAGSQAIAQAAIVDISTPEHKARNLGLILFFMSLGFLFGPLIGGFLSNQAIMPWFNFAMPFYFAAAIASLNALLLWLFFKETFKQTAPIKIKLHHAIEIFISAFTNKKVRALSIIFLIMIFGWSGFYSFISLFLLKTYHFSPMDVALFMATMGVGFGIGTGLLVDFCANRVSLRMNVIAGLSLAAICALIIVLAPYVLAAWLAIVPLCLAIAIAYSILLTIFSNQVDADSQGWIMGITGALMAFGFGINAVFVGLLADFSPKVPLIITALGLIISAMLMYFYHGANDIPRVKSHS